MRTIANLIIRFIESLGLGGIRVSIITKGTMFTRGDTISGEVTLVGGPLNYHLREVTIAFAEYETTTEGDKVKNRPEVQIARELTLRPRQTHTMQFSVRSPAHGRFSVADAHGKVIAGSRLVAVASYGAGSSRRGHTDLYMKPQPGIAAILRGMEALGFVSGRRAVQQREDG